MTCWAPLTSHHTSFKSWTLDMCSIAPTGGIVLFSVSLNAQVMESWVSVFCLRDSASFSILRSNIDLNINVWPSELSDGTSAEDLDCSEDCSFSLRAEVKNVSSNSTIFIIWELSWTVLTRKDVLIRFFCPEGLNNHSALLFGLPVVWTGFGETLFISREKLKERLTCSFHNNGTLKGLRHL